MNSKCVTASFYAKVICLFTVLSLCVSTNSIAQNNSALLRKLNEAIVEKIKYTSQKKDRIARISRNYSKITSYPQKFQLNRTLYAEYQKFQIDSAASYALKNLAIAKAMNSPNLIVTAQLDLANIYFPLNKFLEANELLQSINPHNISKGQLADYYAARAEFYQHYVANNENGEYQNSIRGYQDSLLKILDHNSLDYQEKLSVRNILAGQTREPEEFLLRTLKNKDKMTPDYAMLTYLLGLDYAKQNESTKAIRYYAESATLDVRFAIKDNASMQELALLLYATGDIDNAYRCTQSAIEDALFSDSKFRTLHISEFYAIINTAYLKKEAKQKDQLRLYLILISALSIFLAGVAVYVYKQMKRESRIKKALNSTTLQLSELNRTLNSTNLRLNEANSALLEANKIKEVYIAQFFDLCSAYINKLENFRKVLNKKASEKHLDELIKILRSTAMVNQETDELYKIFDRIFLSLYPNFISGFNSLLIPEERMSVKPGELLNTELRIYALIRLGITDSAQIAAFLRYSLSTIYNYRTSARNKAVVSRDSFEQSVMKIGLIGA
jgi:DNA-binding CsgD family transcriptional regulator